MSQSSTNHSANSELLQRRADELTARELLSSCAPHQRALLRILAVCSHHGIDPNTLLMGFANELPDRYGDGARQLADGIAQGVDWVDALDDVRGLLPGSSVLALRLAREDGRLPGLLSALMGRFSDDQIDLGQEDSPASAVGRVGVRIFFMVWILGFLMLKIIPEFQKMFEEFGLELPAVMQLLMAYCDRAIRFWFLLPLAMIFLLPFCIPMIRQYFGRWSTLTWRQPRFIRPVYQRRALALITQATQSVSAGIGMLLGGGSIGRPSKRFSRANSKIENGQDVWDSLAAENVISRRDASALSMTTDGDTQAWLLRWSANDRQKRSETRFAILFRILLAVVHIFLGLVVALTCVAVFMTLISLIESLA